MVSNLKIGCRVWGVGELGFHRCCVRSSWGVLHQYQQRGSASQPLFPSSAWERDIEAPPPDY
jgi:hypothetical protein